METGRLYASRTPVTTAERSKIVFSFLQIFSKIHSDNMHDATQTPITSSERQPKIITEATPAGSRAISTSSIIFCVVTEEFMWGETEEISLFIFVLLIFFQIFVKLCLCKLVGLDNMPLCRAYISTATTFHTQIGAQLFQLVAPVQPVSL